MYSYTNISQRHFCNKATAYAVDNANKQYSFTENMSDVNSTAKRTTD